MNLEKQINNNVEDGVSELTQLADLLDDTPTEIVETKEGTAPEKESAKPNDLKALAEKFAAEDKDLYAIEVPMANGESLTLGQLKDIAGKQDEQTVRELEFEETRAKREQELLRAQGELTELMAVLPKNAVNPEVLQRISEKHEATLQRERAATLQVIPEWNDEAKRTDEITEIVKYLEGYGLSMNYLTQVSDHRMLKLIRDSWQRQVRMDNALKAVRNKPDATVTSKSNSKAPKKPVTQVRRSTGLSSPLADLLK